jgi:cell division protein FtsA
MKQHVTVGIDIGTYQTRVIVCENSGTNVPKVLSVATAPSKGLRHGYIVSREEASQVIKKVVKEAEKESGQKIRQASLCIGGIGLASEYANGSSIITRADGVISKFDIEKAIADAEKTLDLKNRAILHAFPVLFRVDGKELPTRPEGTIGVKLEVKVLFITCFEQHLDDLLAVIGDAGVKVTNFIATPIATEQLLLSDLQKNFGCALIDIGAETVSISVFENNTLASLHVFGIGSSDITKDIALGLRITPEEAESLKLGVVSFQSVPKKKLEEIIEARLSDIFELVDKYLKKIGRSGLLPAGAIIIGGGSLIPMTESVAKSMLKIPARIGYFEMSSVKMPIKDVRILTAYGAATNAVESTQAKSSKHSNDGEGFAETLKNFFKQLMP